MPRTVIASQARTRREAQAGSVQGRPPGGIGPAKSRGARSGEVEAASAAAASAGEKEGRDLLGRERTLGREVLGRRGCGSGGVLGGRLPSPAATDPLRVPIGRSPLEE